MRSRHLVHLDELVGVASCDFRCSRCDRAGRYAVDALARRFGAESSLASIMSALAADCPRRRHGQPILELCGIHCPTLTARHAASGY